MKSFHRVFTGFLAASLLLCTACSSSANSPSRQQESTAAATTPPTESVDVTATYKILVDSFDWGPASVKAILSLSQSCRESDLCSFTVTETAPNGLEFDRTVTDVYLCDSEGNKVSDASAFIAIDMDVVPCGAGSIFLYNTIVYRNEFCDTYRLDIKPATGSTGCLSTLTVDPVLTEMLIPDISVFQTDTYTRDDITLNYGFYSPKEDDAKHPLIIWLHGQGEGGADVRVALLGNRVTAFTEDAVQSAFSGAYVLLPQCPTYWPEAVPNTATSDYSPDGTSAYTEPLMGLIQEVLSENTDIDTNRIYIGGCSNGGYMTMNMLFTYPDFFAAAFPVCPYYPDNLIDDQDLSVLEKTPLWYTYCTFDGAVDPKHNAAATIKRLKDAGVSVHVSEYMDVHDTTGLYLGSNKKPFVYNSHFSWIYVLNNECKDGDLSLWDFIAAQTKT